MHDKQTHQTPEADVMSDPFQSMQQTKRSPVLLILGGLFLLIIGFTAGQYFGKNTPQVDTTESLPPIQPRATLSVSQTGEWETFISQYNNIRFQYPSIYQPPEDREGYIALLSPLDPSPQKGYELKDNELKMEVYVSASFTNDTLDTWVEEQKKKTEGTISVVGTSMIDGVEAQILKAEGYGSAKLYLILNNNKRIRIIKYPFASTRDQEFDQILSTFEFMDENDAMTDTSCEAGDQSICPYIQIVSDALTQQDFTALIATMDTSSVTCNSEGYIPSICQGVADGETRTGYSLLYNMSEGDMLSKEQTNKPLQNYAQQAGLFEYIGIIEQDNKAFIVYIGTENDDLFAVPLKKEDETWTAPFILLGYTSEDFRNLEETTLNSIR